METDIDTKLANMTSEEKTIAILKWCIGMSDEAQSRLLRAFMLTKNTNMSIDEAWDKSGFTEIWIKEGQPSIDV